LFQVKKKCDGNKLATIALFIVTTREEKKCDDNKLVAIIFFASNKKKGKCCNFNLTLVTKSRACESAG
jgi:hypothetical protein